MGANESLGLGVVDRGQLIVVLEVRHRALVIDESKAFTVEREFVRKQARIAHRHRAEFTFTLEVGALTRHIGLIEDRQLTGVHQIAYRRLDGFHGFR